MDDERRSAAVHIAEKAEQLQRLAAAEGHASLAYILAVVVDAAREAADEPDPPSGVNK